jgi:hypothetical protein
MVAGPGPVSVSVSVSVSGTTPHPHVQTHGARVLSQAVMVMLAVVTTPVWSGVWTVRMAFQVPGSGKW